MAKFTIDAREIEKAIAEEARSSGVVRDELDDFVEQVADTVRDLAPVDTGKLKASIRTRRKGGNLNGIDKTGAQVGEIVSTDDESKVAAIEDRDAPFLRAAFRHGGTGKSGT